MGVHALLRQYNTPGFMPNVRQYRQFGLAVIDIAQVWRVGCWRCQNRTNISSLQVLALLILLTDLAEFLLIVNRPAFDTGETEARRVFWTARHRQHHTGEVRNVTNSTPFAVVQTNSQAQMLFA